VAGARPSPRGLVGPFSGRQLALVLGSVLIAAIVLVAITTPLGTTGNTGPRDPRATAVVVGPVVEGLRPGDRAPKLTVTADDGREVPMTDPDGRPIDLAELHGKAVWINFWASWCPPCQGETPIIRELAAEYADRGLVVVGINVQETVEVAADYRDRYGLRHLIGVDVRADVFHRYKVYALPTQFFIDPDGIIRERFVGPVDRASGAASIEAILPSE